MGEPDSLCGGLLVFAGYLAMALCVQAQEAAPNPAQGAPTTGSIHGVVTSADGTVYEGARVDLTLRGPNAAPVVIRQTNSDGAFSFTDLPAGMFKLAISSPGFMTQEVSGVLHAGETFDARTIVLPVAGASTDVRVSAESQGEIAQEQLNLEEKQRVLGVFPNYYVSYDHDAVPLTTRQKYELAWKTSIDPVTWAMTGVVAGAEQASNTFAEYGQGAQGYGKRFGANYVDGFTGTMIGGAILPSLLKQDPRYFYKGTGTVKSRVMYAIANSVICKGDNGRWQPAYSGILGGVAAGGISNLYYPDKQRSGVELTFENTLVGTAESAVQNLIQEFVVRRLTPKLPVYPSTATQ